jgi:hypothetical protein
VPLCGEEKHGCEFFLPLIGAIVQEHPFGASYQHLAPYGIEDLFSSAASALVCLATICSHQNNSEVNDEIELYIIQSLKSAAGKFSSLSLLVGMEHEVKCTNHFQYGGHPLASPLLRTRNSPAQFFSPE